MWKDRHFSYFEFRQLAVGEESDTLWLSISSCFYNCKLLGPPE